MTDPQLGEKILDPACGTGGFLVETYAYLYPSVEHTRFVSAGRRGAYRSAASGWCPAVWQQEGQVVGGKGSRAKAGQHVA
jgi:hypothetical protein